MIVFTFLMLIFSTSSLHAQTTITISTNTSWRDISPQPTSSTDIIVRNQATLTVDISTAVCKSITLGPNDPSVNNSNGNLSFNASSQVTVSGVVTFSNHNNRTNNINMTSGGRLICQGFAVGASGTNTFTPGTGTVELTANNTLPSTIVTTFNNLIISGGTTKLSATATRAYSIIVENGAALDLNGVVLTNSSPLTLNGTGISNNGALINSSANAATYPGAIALATETIINTTGNITLGSNGISGAQNLIKTGNGILNLGGGNITLGNLTISSGTLYSTSGTLNLAGNFINNSTFTGNNGIVVYNGGTQTIGGTSPTTFNNLSISSSGSTTLSRNTNVIGDLSVTSGIFDLVGFTCNRIAAGGTLTVANGATIKIGGTTNPMPVNYSTYTLGATSTVEFYGTDKQTIPAIQYGNLVSANHDRIFALGTIYIQGTFTPPTTAYGEVTGNTIVFNGGGTQTIPAFSYNNLSSSGTGARILDPSDVIDISGIFDPGTNLYTVEGSTVNFNGGSPQAIPAFTYYNLTSSGISASIDGIVNVTGNLMRPINGAVVVGPTGFLTAAKVTTDHNDTNPANSGILTIAPKGRATITNFVNYGILNLQSDEFGIGSLIVDSYDNSIGTENIDLYLTGGGNESENNWAWHYISTPVDGINVSTLTGGTSSDLDLYQYVESLPVGTDPPSFQNGWIAHDTWSPVTQDLTNSNGFSTLKLGKGYNYWWDGTKIFNISGPINTTIHSMILTNTGNDPVYSGYNLLGNPFTSGLNLEYMMDPLADPQRWPSNTLMAVWFTSNNQSYAYSNGVSVPDIEAPGHIPPMQGFFVKTTANGETFNFPLGAREHNAASRFKGEKATLPLIRISVSKDGKSGETVVRFNEKADMELDMYFDATRFLSSSTKPEIFTSLNGTDFTINGIPFPEKSVEIPVTVKLLTEGNHIITAMEIQELANYKATLTDKTTGSTVDLNSVKEYAFAAPAGEIKDRFILAITKLTTDIENPLAADALFNIYHGFGLINIQPLSDEWDGESGSVRIMDLSGKPVRVEPNAEFNKHTLIQLPAPDKAGLYFVDIRSGMMKFTGKVVVK